MSTTNSKIILLTALCLNPLVWADGMPDSDKTEQKDITTGSQTADTADRKIKIEMFDKTAQCLRSNKTDVQCEKELTENCHHMGGMKHCGMGMMMGSMGKSTGNMQDGKMGGGMMRYGMGKMGRGMMGDGRDKEKSSQGTSSGAKKETME